MKQQLVKIGGVFLIVVLATNVITPLHVAASPGTVSISGHVSYQPRNWDPQKQNWRSGKEIQIQLYELDLHGHKHKLDSTNTDSAGNFVFPARTNWWGEDNRQLNVFLRIVTAYPSDNSPVTSVTDLAGAQYAFDSSPTFLNRDGSWRIDFPVTSGWNDYQAIWIFEDLRNTWDYINHNDFRNGQWYDPGSVRAVWEDGSDCYPTQIPFFQFNCDASSTYAGPFLDPFIYIRDFDNDRSMDVVSHETGHMFMFNANGWWYANIACFDHRMFNKINANCAWSEGWADFLPLVISDDQCYNFLDEPCKGVKDVDYFDLELHSRADNPTSFPWGDEVEGRIAAALYDIKDNNYEGFDSRAAGFSPISKIALGSSPIATFHDFWLSWTGSGQERVLTALTLWWNTIEEVNFLQSFVPLGWK